MWPLDSSQEAHIKLSRNLPYVIALERAFVPNKWKLNVMPNLAHECLLQWVKLETTKRSYVR